MEERSPAEAIQISLGEMRYVPAPDGEPPAPAPAPERKSISWDKIGERFSDIRTATLNGLIVLMVIGMVALTVAEVRRVTVVIDPIRLPPQLQAMGYSEDVAAYRLWDEVAAVYESTPTAKDRVTLLPASQRMDFEAPVGGVSLQTVVKMLRPVLGLVETRIAGEFICGTPDCAPEGLALRLRVFSGEGMRIIPLPPIGKQTDEAAIDRYFRSAAVELLRALDPYVVAFYHFQTDKALAEREASQLIGPTNPQRKWALNLLGYIAADRGDYDAAIDWYKRAVAADKDDSFAIAYTNWGNALRAKGDPDAAIEKFQRATEIDPKYAFAFSNWGIALADKGDSAGAMDKHAHAAKLDPSDPFTYNTWGNALYVQGDLDGAIEKYSRATEFAPNDALAFFNWGVALDQKGDLDGAADKFQRATELDPNDAGAFTKWGIVLQQQGKLGAAIEKLTRATELDPRSEFAFNNLGVAQGSVGNLEGATASFTRATELDPAYATAHFNRGLVLQMLERNKDAADAFQSYLDLSPDDEKAQWARSQIEQMQAAEKN